jgi:hypothetical protein
MIYWIILMIKGSVQLAIGSLETIECSNETNGQEKSKRRQE